MVEKDETTICRRVKRSTHARENKYEKNESQIRWDRLYLDRALNIRRRFSLCLSLSLSYLFNLTLSSASLKKI